MSYDPSTWPCPNYSQLKALQRKWRREGGPPATGLIEALGKIGIGPFIFTGHTWDEQFGTMRVLVRPARDAKARFSPVEVTLDCRRYRDHDNQIYDADKAVIQLEKFIELRFAEWLLVRDCEGAVRTRMWMEDPADMGQHHG